MQNGDAVVGEQVANLAEEGVVVVDPDMLEHADRDDPVKAAGLVAIVLELETDAPAAAGLPSPCLARPKLLARERDAEHLTIRGVGEEQR
jgi:hypothetical protein